MHPACHGHSCSGSHTETPFENVECSELEPLNMKIINLYTNQGLYKNEIASTHTFYVVHVQSEQQISPLFLALVSK